MAFQEYTKHEFGALSVNQVELGSEEKIRRDHFVRVAVDSQNGLTTAACGQRYALARNANLPA